MSINERDISAQTWVLRDTITTDLSPAPAPSGTPGGSGTPAAGTDGFFLDPCDGEDLTAAVCTRTQRSVPGALATHLAGDGLTLAYCLKLTRRDGTVMGFTTCDQDLTFGGVTYEALNSLSLTALRQELGGRVGDTDLSGLLRSDRITDADIYAGRYDGAAVTLSLVNWASLADGAITLARGWIGSLTVVDGQWRAQFRSLSQRLQQQIVELTSETCRVKQLGDSRCKIDLSGFQFSRTVAATADGRNFTFGSDAHLGGYYTNGRVIFTSGLNAGLDREVKTHTRVSGQAVIELQEAMPFTVSIGDTATLEAGCDRTAGQCRSRFNNLINIRAEPHVPGESALKRVETLIKRLGG